MAKVQYLCHGYICLLQSLAPIASHILTRVLRPSTCGFGFFFAHDWPLLPLTHLAVKPGCQRNGRVSRYPSAHMYSTRDDPCERDTYVRAWAGSRRTVRKRVSLARSISGRLRRRTGGDASPLRTLGAPSSGLSASAASDTQQHAAARG